MLKEFVYSKQCSKCEALLFILQKYYSKDVKIFTNLQISQSSISIEDLKGYPTLKDGDAYILGMKSIIKHLKFPMWKYKLIKFIFKIRKKLCLA